MASKDRPSREVKKKPKAAPAKPKLQSLLDEPPKTVEVIRPVRKPRHEKETDEG